MMWYWLSPFTAFQVERVNERVSSYNSNPSEKFELTTNSLGALIETHGKFIFRNSVTSEWTHRMTHTESLLWAFCEFATHTVSLLWAICEIILVSSPCSGSSEITVKFANSQKAHSKLSVWVILRVHCVMEFISRISRIILFGNFSVEGYKDINWKCKIIKS